MVLPNTIIHYLIIPEQLGTFSIPQNISHDNFPEWYQFQFKNICYVKGEQKNVPFLLTYKIVIFQKIIKTDKNSINVSLMAFQNGMTPKNGTILGYLKI